MRNMGIRSGFRIPKYKISNGGLMISKILVATDGSEQAKKAVKYGAALAKQTDATIILLSVKDEIFSVAQPPLAVAVEDYIQKYAETCLKEAEKICVKNGIKPKKRVIRQGHPADEIVKEAIKSKVNLIVLNSHGRSTVGAAFLGSVAYGVIHKDTKIPVLVVR